MVFQLTYSSVASRGISVKDIENIIAEAKQFNTANNITGCLIYNNGYFLQILEGDKEIVMTLLNKIRLDDRNDHLSILSEDQSNFRIFKDWAMAYYHNPKYTNLTSEEQEIKESLLLLSNSLKKPNFALKVFWYNVKKLLTEDGYYKTT